MSSCSCPQEAPFQDPALGPSRSSVGLHGLSTEGPTGCRTGPLGQQPGSCWKRRGPRSPTLHKCRGLGEMAVMTRSGLCRPANSLPSRGIGRVSETYFLRKKKTQGPFPLAADARKFLPTPAGQDWPAGWAALRILAKAHLLLRWGWERREGQLSPRSQHGNSTAQEPGACYTTRDS